MGPSLKPQSISPKAIEECYARWGKPVENWVEVSRVPVGDLDGDGAGDYIVTEQNKSMVRHGCSPCQKYPTHPARQFVRFGWTCEYSHLKTAADLTAVVKRSPGEMLCEGTAFQIGDHIRYENKTYEIKGFSAAVNAGTPVVSARLKEVRGGTKSHPTEITVPISQLDQPLQECDPRY